MPDALGSVRQIVDANGNVTLAKSYEPYGSVLNSSGSATSIFGYAGEQFDTTGLIYLRARYMQPTLGIFTSRDPWSGDEMRPGSMNGFGYVEGNPANRVDPSGQIFGGPKCMWPNHEEQDPRTGQRRCVSSLGIVIGQVGVGTLPGTGDPASELLKWLTLAGINVCVDVVTEIIREQRYEPQVIVELGAGDYENAIKMKENFPNANVFATNLFEEWKDGELFSKFGQNPLPGWGSEFYSHALAVYEGWKKAKKHNVIVDIVGKVGPIQNGEIAGLLAGQADIIYTINPYPHAEQGNAFSFGVLAGILAKNQPGTIVFATGSFEGTQSFVNGYQVRHLFADFGLEPATPFGLDPNKGRWEDVTPLTRMHIQTALLE